MDQCRSAFSLVEVLVVIAVIGILAAIALPHFAPVVDATSVVRDRHNAGDIITTYITGTAAGVHWPVGDAATKVSAVITGQKLPAGAFSNTMFRSSVTPDMSVTTYPFIGVQSDGELFYDSTANQDPSGH